MSATETSQEVIPQTGEVQGEEAKAPEQVEQVEGQEGKPEGEQEQVKERDEKGRFKGVQPRIDELTKARREAEREAAYWRQMAQQQQAQSQEQANAKPTPDQFEDYAAYVEALTDWKTEQKLNERLSQEAQRKVVQTVEQTFEQRVAEYRKTASDFDEVVGAAETPVTPQVAQAIKESDVGPQLLYHFARNPQDLQRINGMSEAQANREIGRLEAQLAAKPAPVAPPVKTTQAPKPASVIGSQGRGAVTDPARMSMEEYQQYRKSQGARWAR